MVIKTNELKGLYPDQSFPANEIVPNALIFELATIAGNIEGDAPAIRVPYVKEDPAAGFVAEGATIPTEAPELDEILVKTGKLAHITKQSNEAAHYGDAFKLIAASLSRALIVKANNALLSNPEADTNPTGLLNIDGIQDAGTLTTSLDPISNAITLIETAGGTATHITVDPATWGTIRDLKQTADSNMPLIGAPSEQTERRLFGLPVIVSPQVPAGTLLVTDQNEIIAAAGQVKLATSEHTYYISDSLAHRVTWRIGWNVVRPERLAKVTV